MEFIRSTRAHYLAVGLILLFTLITGIVGYFEVKQLTYCAHHQYDLSAYAQCERFYR